MEKRLSALLRLAIKSNASDIHLSLRYGEVTIQMRVDGDLKKVKPKIGDDRLIRYLQYLSNLDIGTSIDPQTGKFEYYIDDVLLSLRFAVITMPDRIDGVLRIMNSSLKIDEEHLSCRKWQNELFHSLVRRENGLILFSGKTGSGKTTTLYNLLKQVSYKKIYTIEDPIEVYDENFVQLQVTRTAGLNYEHYVQQVLRHDPDIIMIGEIRDEKAARIAVVAANTGHLVLSTIHASSASSIISRMSELGVREDHLYEVLLCLSNQKMVNNTDGGKTVIYELMDEEEIEYFRKNGRNSEDFESVEKQYRQGVKENRFKVDS